MNIRCHWQKHPISQCMAMTHITFIVSLLARECHNFTASSLWWKWFGQWHILNIKALHGKTAEMGEPDLWKNRNERMSTIQPSWIGTMCFDFLVVRAGRSYIMGLIHFGIRVHWHSEACSTWPWKKRKDMYPDGNLRVQRFQGNEKKIVGELLVQVRAC